MKEKIGAFATVIVGAILCSTLIEAIVGVPMMIVGCHTLFNVE